MGMINPMIGLVGIVGKCGKCGKMGNHCPFVRQGGCAVQVSYVVTSSDIVVMLRALHGLSAGQQMTRNWADE
jgi:hypothetical protein